MSIASLLLRFAIAYPLLLAAVGVALHLLGVEGNSGVNTAALLGAVLWACLSFAKKNGRYFSRDEKTRVVLGMVAIDVAIQTALPFALAAMEARPIPLASLAIVLAVVALLHAAVIYFFVGLAGRQFARQAVQDQARGPAP